MEDWEYKRRNVFQVVEGNRIGQVLDLRHPRGGTGDSLQDASCVVDCALTVLSSKIVYVEIDRGFLFSHVFILKKVWTVISFVCLFDGQSRTYVDKDEWAQESGDLGFTAGSPAHPLCDLRQVALHPESFLLKCDE